MNTTFGSFGQLFDLCAVQKVCRDALDAPAGELFAQALFAETSHADDALARCRALGQAGERGSNLAANTQNDEVARYLLEIGNQRR